MDLPRRLLLSLFRLGRTLRPGARRRVRNLSAEQRARLRENLRSIMQPKAS